jgi:hypothetical protein
MRPHPSSTHHHMQGAEETGTTNRGNGDNKRVQLRRPAPIWRDSPPFRSDHRHWLRLAPLALNPAVGMVGFRKKPMDAEVVKASPITSLLPWAAKIH